MNQMKIQKIHMRMIQKLIHIKIKIIHILQKLKEGIIQDLILLKKKMIITISKL